jgi:hypothetical protein
MGKSPKVLFNGGSNPSSSTKIKIIAKLLDIIKNS